MDDTQLIELIRDSPCLYDKTNKDFKNPQKKKYVWMEIAKNLGIEESVAVKRWGNLRERFSKEIRNTRNTSGSGASVGRQWPLLENLKFLKCHIIPRPMRQSAQVLDRSVEGATNDEMLCEPILWAESSNETQEITPAQFPQISPLDSSSVPLAENLPSTSRGRKRNISQRDDVDTAILDSAKAFKELSAERRARSEYGAEISGFSTMISSAIASLRKPNQSLVMRRCIEIVMQAQIDECEKENTHNDF